MVVRPLQVLTSEVSLRVPILCSPSLQRINSGHGLSIVHYGAEEC
jgi:hypothetical protein